MNNYQCTVCQYIYSEEKGDPNNGVAENTAFAALPSDWVCPVCGVPQSSFEVLEMVEG
ncbi:MAG: rubredoxin [Rikenellaceae bacterium]